MKHLLLSICLFATFFSFGQKASDKSKLASADAYRKDAFNEVYHGDVHKGMDLYHKAISIYESIHNQEDKLCDIYYNLSMVYLQSFDTVALGGAIEKMKLLTQQDLSPFISHSFYAVQTAYYASLLELKPFDGAYLDSGIKYASLSIELGEKHSDSMDRTVVRSWDYYNLAVLYDKYSKPHPFDKINELLDKALAVRNLHDTDVSIEVEISVNDLRAWGYYYKKKYAQAEALSKKNIRLIESMPNRANTLLVELYETYLFLEKIYEENGQLDSALKYQKYLLETSEKRFNLDRTELINNLQIKHEVKTKDLQIELLTNKAEVARKQAWILGLLLAMVAIIFMLWRLKRKHSEQKRYETVLESELDRDETDIIHKIILCKLQNTLSESRLSLEVKQKYINNLETLDVEKLNVYLSETKVKLSSMDVKYICCFYIGMETKDIANVFHIEPASVNTVRYRLRKKVGKVV